MDERMYTPEMIALAGSREKESREFQTRKKMKKGREMRERDGMKREESGEGKEAALKTPPALN